MSDEPELESSGRTETTVRRFDKDGALVEESTTTTVRHEKPSAELPIGMYL